MRRNPKPTKKKTKNQNMRTVDLRAKAQMEHDKLKRLMSKNRSEQLGNEPLTDYITKKEDKDEQFNKKIDALVERNKAISEALDISEETIQNRQTEKAKFKPPRYEKRISGVEAMREQAKREEVLREEETRKARNVLALVNSDLRKIKKHKTEKELRKEIKKKLKREKEKKEKKEAKKKEARKRKDLKSVEGLKGMVGLNDAETNDLVDDELNEEIGNFIEKSKKRLGFSKSEQEKLEDEIARISGIISKKEPKKLPLSIKLPPVAETPVIEVTKTPSISLPPIQTSNATKNILLNLKILVNNDKKSDKIIKKVLSEVESGDNLRASLKRNMSAGLFKALEVMSFPDKEKGRGKKRGRKPPFWLDFGRFKIDQKKLIENNEMSVRFRDTIDKPRNFKNKRNVSLNFKNIILNLVRGVKNVDISALNAHEKKYIKDFLKASETGRSSTGGAIMNDVEDVVHRYDLLVGEIRAGNDSRKVRNELSNIINELVKKGVLTVSKAIQITKQLIADI